jgi:hypothetical protein
MKAQTASACIPVLILKFGTRWGDSHGRFTRGKKNPGIHCTEGCVVPVLVWMGVETRKFLSPTGINSGVAR